MDETMNTAAVAEEAAADGWDELVEDGEVDAAGQDGPDDGGQDGGQQPTAEAAQEDADGKETGGEAPGERFAVKYNGQVMDLTRDEMVTLAQKGMNYDKINQRLQDVLDGPEHRLIARMAAASGMTAEAYLARAEEMLADQFVQEQGAQGVPEQAARQMWQDRQELAAYREQAAREASRQDAAARQEQALQEEFLAFVREYPDVKALPPEVIAIKQANPADSITSAYRKWELGQLRTQLEAKKVDKTNRETSPGSAAGAGRAEIDPFLAGWGDV